MSNSDILERSPIMIRENVIQLVQRVESLDYMSKHRMLPIQIVYIIRQGDEELTSTTSTVLVIYSRGHSHGDGSFVFVFETRDEFGCEVSLARLVLLGGCERPDGFSSFACS